MVDMTKRINVEVFPIETDHFAGSLELFSLWLTYKELERLLVPIYS